MKYLYCLRLLCWCTAIFSEWDWKRCDIWLQKRLMEQRYFASDEDYDVVIFGCRWCWWRCDRGRMVANGILLFSCNAKGSWRPSGAISLAMGLVVVSLNFWVAVSVCCRWWWFNLLSLECTKPLVQITWGFGMELNCAGAIACFALISFVVLCFGR